jgi:hypothetical protein
MSILSSRRPSAAEAWDVLYEDPTLRVWALRDLLGVAWFEAPTREQMVELQRLAKARARTHPKGVGLFQLVVRGTPRFTDDVRAEVDRITKENTFARGSAHIILVQGLAGAAARAFLSTVLLVRRSSIPAKVFSDLDAAAAWCAREIEPAWHADQVLRMAQALVASGDHPPSSIRPR